MRLWPLSSLLFAIALGAAGCSSAGGDASPDDFAPTNDQIISTTNPMGLRLVYDDPSGHVRATMPTKLAAGEKLVLRIRRGRLTPGGAALLDCSALPDAPAFPAVGAYARVVYDGPEVDRSLLASVYSQDWIDANISQDVLERLSRDGSDSIVEACIITAAAVDGGAANAIPSASARIREQTSIQDAWDSSDPHLAPALRARNRAAAAAAR